jgi:type II secretory pathway pseudopilin PulG
MHQEKGFKLLELLMVAAILIALAAIVIPRIVSVYK